MEFRLVISNLTSTRSFLPCDANKLESHGDQ